MPSNIVWFKRWGMMTLSENIRWRRNHYNLFSINAPIQQNALNQVSISKYS